YVKDCVVVMLWLWRQGPASGIYNLGTGEARSFLDLMNAVGAACGIAPKIEYVDMPSAIRPNYQYFTEAVMTRLRQAGYNAPFASLEDAVRRLRDATPGVSLARSRPASGVVQEKYVSHFTFR